MEQDIQAFMEALRMKAVSEHTLLAYESDIRELDTFARLREMALEAMDHIFIREFLAHLYDRKLQKTSVSRKLAALRSFFKFLVRDGRLKSNPAELISS